MENLRIMLEIIKTIKKLNIEQILQVYEESILANAEQSSTGKRQAEDAFYAYLEDDFFRQPSAFYAIWKDADIYQCALRIEPYRDGLLLEALETAPTARRKGYAIALMKGVLDYLKDSEYKIIYSHVEKRNRASVKLHQKCGFQICSDSATYIDGTVTQNSYTLRCDL